MPLKEAEEAAKVVVEASGSAHSILQWILGGIATGATALVAHVSGRLKHLEKNRVTSERFEEHVKDEDDKLATLFSKHDRLLDKVSSIQASVARIEGKLDK